MNAPFRKLLPLAVSAVATAALLVACDRPGAQVIASGAEKYSRNGAATQPANELPRDTDAAAREPAPASLPSREAISDTMITAKVKAALIADSGMAGADVSVNTEHGVVILAGNVKSHEQSGIASAHAQRQDGVMRVDNQLSLAPQ
jgi:hyperosmotically inducible protein